MERQTFERALHSWEGWHQSIERSRETLRYDPAWKKETCIEWIEENYPAIKNQGQKELQRLQLPPTLQGYWEDCFYSNYRIEGSSVYSRITRRLSEVKSLPHPPCDYGVVWYEDEDIHAPWLRVEIKLHARFATKELLNYAARYAYDTVKSHVQSYNIQPHPVCQWLKGGRPPMDDDRAIECARLKDDLGWTYQKIGLHFGWPLEVDNYGKPTRCNKARLYVRHGRKLRKIRNNKP